MMFEYLISDIHWEGKVKLARFRRIAPPGNTERQRHLLAGEL